MRRCPCSTNTIATMIPVNISPTRTMAAVPDSALTAAKLAGSRLTTEEKIRRDMPLPMPRWVMVSPIHINRAKPAVRVSTTSTNRFPV